MMRAFAKSASMSPVVITGPSGCGKSSLLSMLFQRHPNQFAFSVSHTTRQPRPGEHHGRAYYFVSKSEFDEMVRGEAFLEWATFGGNGYGTSRAEIEGILKRGMIPILDVERQGVLALKDHLGPAGGRFVYVKPPSFEDLRTRLAARGTESHEVISKRLEQANRDMEWAAGATIWNAVIVNDDLDRAYRQLESFVFDRE